MIEILLEREDDYMGDMFSVRAFDGTLVRVPKDKAEVFLKRQEKIKRLMNEGKSKQEIEILLKEGLL